MNYAPLNTFVFTDPLILYWFGVLFHRTADDTSRSGSRGVQ